MHRRSRFGAASVVSFGLLLALSTASTGVAAAHEQHGDGPRTAAAPLTVPGESSSTTALDADIVRAQAAAPDGLDVPPTPRAVCGPGSHPETGRQGRVPLTEVRSGRAAEGYRCNTAQVSHYGKTGGYKVERYVDAAGHECAFYDSTLLFPLNLAQSPGQPPGVYVLDMTNPANPVRTAFLETPAMQSPHESLVLNHKRGLLAAVFANPVFYPGQIDIYDVSVDCRSPQLKSSLPVGVLGHESGFAPDGNTFYAASLSGRTVTAVDVSNPLVPVPLGVYDYNSHGLNVSDDGNRIYMAGNGNTDSTSPKGLIILDSSEIQARKPNPQLKVVSKMTWALVSTPQNAIPVTIKGHPYVVEVDEFVGGDRVGAARIIDIANEKAPKVVGNMRLEVHQAAARKTDQANDSGNTGPSAGLQGYTGHYCNVPSRVDPGIVACTFILSGLRVFDIRDPYNPKEIAYFNGPIQKTSATGGDGSAYAMSSPSFVPARSEIWYTDGNSGFYAVRITNNIWPFPADTAGGSGSGSNVAGSAGGRSGRSGTLAATGSDLPLAPAGLAMVAALGLRRLRRRTSR